MTTAILSALIDEQRHLLDRLEAPQRVEHAGRGFVTGRLHGHTLVLALSRIGKVAAATTAAALIERFGVSRIVFTGVAGGLGAGVRVGDIVVASELLQHDLDASPLFPRHEVPLYGLARFPTDADLSGRLAEAARQTLAQADGWLDAGLRARYGLATPALHHGLIVSGDRFVATGAESRALQAELPEALAVEMEGAAVAQVCFDYGVPFAALRTVSDRADDAAHTDFPAFVRDVASHYSDAVLGAWLRMLPNS